MALTCASPRYKSCADQGGRFQDRIVSGQGTWGLTQDKSNNITAIIGGVAVTLQSRERHFSMSTAGSWSKDSYFIYQCGDETEAYAYCDCFTQHSSNSESLSESYQTTDTVIAYLDLRFGLALCKEVKDSLAFTPSSSGLAKFLGPWGVTYTHKFRMNTVDRNRETTWYAIHGGAKHILNTTSEVTHLHTEQMPLILISARMPPDYMPWDDELIQYGFYDYGDEGLRISDGGDDFYYTEWMRQCGINQVQDAADAAFRYDNYFLAPTYQQPFNPQPPSVPMPSGFFDPTPQGSMIQDKDGNVCYSWAIDGQVFNFITGGDLQTLTGVSGSNFKAYPVGII